MSHLADNRAEQFTEREQAISNARSALRAEREQLAAERAEADRLLAEARATHREANRIRDRAKRLAGRFVRRVKHQHGVESQQLEERAARLDADRNRFTAEMTRFETIRSEFNSNAAAARDRLRDAWAAVRTQQKRMAGEWIEANRRFSEENAILNTRAAELARQEKIQTDNRARIEAETAGFREEATSLEARIENARTSLAELEVRRDRARAELLGTELPGELSTAADSEDLLEREHVFASEITTVASLKTSLEQESADNNDRQRIVAEQLTMLAEARAKWQRAEQQTVIEMEQLARELGQRERELNIREQRLIRADIRRRDEAYDLWQLRLRLEAWQTKLTAFEMRWHTEREQMEADLDRRITIITRRETELEETFGAWEKARASERERLQAELELWADDRKRLTTATADFDHQRHELLGELSRHAARALAAEELVTKAVQDSGSDRAIRRLAVLRKRWEWVFDQKAREIDRRRAETTVERATIDERYRELHALLMDVTKREAAVNNQETANLQKKGTTLEELTNGGAISATKPPSSSIELTALRNEVERLATMLFEVELPEPPDLPIGELPWAVEEPNPPSTAVVPFDSEAWAA
ncbi:MAG TPA: hypothetical protein VG122_12810 [Gemmata sp.]|jgi:hypothetical protein|nr:hypothetical protein [Gemmata sp.]